MIELWKECPDCKGLGKVPGHLFGEKNDKFTALCCNNCQCFEGIIITDDGQQVLDFIRVVASHGWEPFDGRK